MMPKSQAKIKLLSPIYDFKEDMHKLFSQFSILSLCSEMYIYIYVYMNSWCFDNKNVFTAVE